MGIGTIGILLTGLNGVARTRDSSRPVTGGNSAEKSGYCLAEIMNLSATVRAFWGNLRDRKKGGAERSVIGQPVIKVDMKIQWLVSVQ